MSKLVIHATGISQFQKCQQLFLYSDKSAMNLEPVRPVPALHFGTGIHFALATGYSPDPLPERIQFFSEDFTTRLLFAWDYWCRVERKRFENDHPALMEDEEFIQQLDEEVELGRGMLAHYATWAPKHDDWEEVIWVEREFDVPLGRGHRTTFRFSFKPDALVRYADGTYWLVDWKTAANIHDSDEWLQMDRQCGAYIAAIERATGIHVEGIIYAVLRKKVPPPLKRNQDGRYSRDMRQDTTWEIAAKALMDEYGEAEKIPPGYHDLLEKLRQRNAYFKRTRVRRNPTEIGLLWDSLKVEAREIARKLAKPELITRNPSQFNCSSCAFRPPCLLRGEGNEVGEKEVLDQLYRVQI